MELQIQYKVLRLAFAIATTMLVAYLFAWPAYFITPLFVSVILTSDMPSFSLRQAGQFIWASGLLILLGVLIGEFLVPFPAVCALVIFCMLFLGQFLAVSGKPAIMVVMLFIGILVMPLLAMESLKVMKMMAAGLLFSLAVAVLICVIFYAYMPISHSVYKKKEVAIASVDTRFKLAMLKASLCIPVFLVFYLNKMSSDLLILVFVALLIQMPSAAVGIKGAAAMLLANVMGGVVAIAIYQAITIVPNIVFVVLCTFVAMVAFARRLFSESPYAGLYSTGISTILVLLGGATGDGADAALEKLVVRVLQITAAVIYIVVALNLSERLLNKLQEKMARETQPLGS